MLLGGAGAEAVNSEVVDGHPAEESDDDVGEHELDGKFRPEVAVDGVEEKSGEKSDERKKNQRFSAEFIRQS